MIKKYVVVFVIGFFVTIGWNLFLIQRDEKLYKAYYKQQALTNATESTIVKE